MALALLDHVRARLVGFQEDSGHLYNLEATPAEGTTYRFAREDRKRYPRILQAGTPEAPYYTNSSQLPVGFTDDPFEALELQDALQCKYTGGTVLHLYMAERISSAEACKTLVRTALLDLPAARLPGRRARVLPEVRRGTAATLHAQELLRRLRRLSRLSFHPSTSKEYHR